MLGPPQPCSHAATDQPPASHCHPPTGRCCPPAGLRSQPQEQPGTTKTAQRLEKIADKYRAQKACTYVRSRRGDLPLAYL